jgi:LemA protein
MKSSYSEIRIPEDMASEVLALASQYYAEQNQGYKLPELIKAGAEVQISPELIELAIFEVQEKRQQKLDRQKKTNNTVTYF